MIPMERRGREPLRVLADRLSGPVLVLVPSLFVVAAQSLAAGHAARVREVSVSIYWELRCDTCKGWRP